MHDLNGKAIVLSHDGQGLGQGANATGQPLSAIRPGDAGKGIQIGMISHEIEHRHLLASRLQGLDKTIANGQHVRTTPR